MATLTVQEIVKTGLNPTLAAAAGGGDDFANDGRTWFRCKNDGGSPITLTVNSITACDQGSDHDLVISVTNAQERWVGPFTGSRFNDTNGRVGVTYSAVTSVTVAAVKMGTS